MRFTRSRHTLTKMLKELEMNKAAGRYVVWLNFPAFQRCGKEHVRKFLQGIAYKFIITLLLDRRLIGCFYFILYLLLLYLHLYVTQLSLRRHYYYYSGDI